MTEPAGGRSPFESLGIPDTSSVMFAGRRVLGTGSGDFKGGFRMLKEFREFVVRGNVFDMAVGIIIGGAFGTIVKSLVEDVLMPVIGLFVGGVDFSNFYFVLKQGAAAGPYANIAAAKEAGAVVIGYGLFLNHLVSFLIVAFAVFMLVKTVNRMKREAPAPAPAPSTKDCPQCLMPVPVAAKRCGHCTSAI